MSAQKLTADEVTESLTGYDEIAIEKAFGSDWITLSSGKFTTYLRALAFIQFKRDGQSDKDAKDQALGLTYRQLIDHFESGELPDLDPANPDSESGKDDASAA